MALTVEDQALVDLMAAAIESHDYDCMTLLAEAIRKRAAYEKDLVSLSAAQKRPQQVPGRQEGQPQ